MDSKAVPRTEFSFRFFSKTPMALSLLTDSLNRSISEIYLYFTDTPVNFNVCSVPNFSAHPFSVAHNKDVISFEEIDMPVYPSECFVSASPIVAGSEPLDPEHPIAQLYKEQFVIRLDVSIPVEQPDICYEHLKNALTNILENADVPDVTLLSITLDKECSSFPFSVLGCLPNNASGSYSYMPLALPYDRKISHVSVTDKCWAVDGVISNDCIARDMQKIMYGSDALFMSCEDDQVSRCRRIMMDGEKYRLTTLFLQTDNTDLPALLVCDSGFPVWYTCFEDGLLSIERVIFCPQSKTVQSLFNALSYYPSSMMFGDMDSSEINWLFMASKLEIVKSFIAEGSEVFSYLDGDGTLIYEFFVLREDQLLAPCFKGSYDVLIRFFEQIEHTVTKGDVNSALILADDLGCSHSNSDSFEFDVI